MNNREWNAKQLLCVFSMLIIKFRLQLSFRCFLLRDQQMKPDWMMDSEPACSICYQLTRTHFYMAWRTEGSIFSITVTDTPGVKYMRPMTRSVLTHTCSITRFNDMDQLNGWYGKVIPSIIFIRGVIMMTSSNGNIFRVTGHLCGEFTGSRWIPLTKASEAGLWCFLWSASE